MNIKRLEDEEEMQRLEEDLLIPREDDRDILDYSYDLEDSKNLY